MATKSATNKCLFKSSNYFIVYILVSHLKASHKNEITLVLLIQYQHFLGWLFLFLGTKHNLWWLFSFKIGIGIVLCRNTVHVIDHGSIKKLTQNITTAKAFCLPVQMKILEKISNYSQLQWAINIKNSVGIV